MALHLASHVNMLVTFTFKFVFWIKRTDTAVNVHRGRVVQSWVKITHG